LNDDLATAEFHLEASNCADRLIEH
jgi:hypothetical protein